MDEEIVIKKLVEHDEKFDQIGGKMVTKDDLGGIKDVLEEVVTIVKRLDQERVFTTEWVKRIEKGVEDQRQEIDQIKEALNLV